MPTTNTPEPSLAKPEVPKDRAEDARDPKPPLKLDAEEVEERLLPYHW